MLSAEQSAALHDALNECLDRPKKNALAWYVEPFDTEPLNEHSSKREFRRELGIVERGLKHARGLLGEIVGDSADDPKDKAVREILGERIGVLALSYNKREHVSHSLDLFANNARMVGLRYATAFVMFDLIDALETRHKELKDQEKEFWTVTNRPPNYYARTIALRLARVYAREKGEYPTFGTARDGGHPSTAYGRALERIFAILGVEAGIRGPAEWAIQQLTNDDLRKPVPGGLLSNLGFGPLHYEKSGIEKVAEALSKRPE